MAREDLVWRKFEPRMQNRFWFYLEPGGIPSYVCKAASKPSFTQTPVVIDHVNVQRKFKGKTEWQDMTITLQDPVDPISAAAVHDWLLLHHEAVTGIDGYADDYKRELQLDQLGPDGDVLETWILNGAFISAGNFGDLDWSSNEVVTIELTITYDYAEQVF
jgi:hypothetical protein